MKPTPLEEVCRAVNGRWVSRGEAVSVTGVTTDTRSLHHGDLFVALKGDRFDAHEFLRQAAAGGCFSAIVQRDFPVSSEVAGAFPGGLIGVEDTVIALGHLGSHYRGHLQAKVVGVTGSNGKTTVKRMIHHILSRKLAGTCSPKSFNNNIGVPLTLLGANAGDDYVVCEIGTNAPGEIAALGEIARPNVAVITSVGATHLEKLISEDLVAVEKASLLASVAKGGLGIVLADSKPLAHALRPYEKQLPLIRFGGSEQAELRLTAYQPEGRGQRFQVNNHLWVSMPVGGRHMATNALAAIAVAQRFGFTQEQAAAALADFAGVESRLQWETAGRIELIDDTYNANPASMLAAASVLADGPGQRKVLIAGDMKELGPRERELHLETGREIARHKVNLIIGVGELGRYIYQGAHEVGASGAAFDTIEDACLGVSRLLAPGDVVLLKGSRSAKMERLLTPIRQAFAPGLAGATKGSNP